MAFTQSNGGVATTSRLTMFPMLNPFTGAIALYDFDPNAGFNDPVNPSVYSFRVEDIIHGRTPTISRIIVTYRDLGFVTPIFTLSGTDDSGKVQSISTGTNAIIFGNAVPTVKLITQLISLSLTAQNLQLTITRPAGSGPLSIAKVTICGRVENQKLS